MADNHKHNKSNKEGHKYHNQMLQPIQRTKRKRKPLKKKSTKQRVINSRKSALFSPTKAINWHKLEMKCDTNSIGKRESIIGVQWGQGNPNPRVHRFSGKRGFAEFPTGTVDPRVGISRFHCTPMIDSISHISNKE